MLFLLSFYYDPILQRSKSNRDIRRCKIIFKKPNTILSLGTHHSERFSIIKTNVDSLSIVNFIVNTPTNDHRRFRALLHIIASHTTIFAIISNRH
jgi:hypothetical protein